MSVYPNIAYDRLAKLWRYIGCHAAPMSAEDWECARAIARECGVPLAQLVAVMEPIIARNRVRLVRDVIEEFVTKGTPLAWCKESRRQARRVADRVKKVFAGATLFDVLSQPAGIDSRTAALRKADGTPFRESTRHNHSSFVRAAILHATGAWLPISPPTPQAPVRATVSEWKPFKPDVVRAFFAAATETEHAALALMFFGGLTPTEVLTRLRPEDIDVTKRVIVVPPGESRRAPGRTICALHRDANGWVGGAHQGLWPFLAKGFVRPKQGFLGRMQTVTRPEKWHKKQIHFTAAAYFCAKFGVRAATEVLGDTNYVRVKSKFTNRVTTEEADEYFSLSPQSLRARRTKPKLPDNLAALLAEFPIAAILKKYETDFATLKRVCSRRNIKMPEKGFWRRAENKARGQAASRRLFGEAA